MLFNSIDFLIFFPIVIAIYFIIPQKARHIWLLVSSYYFYMSWNPKYALLIIFSTVITYVSSLFIEKFNMANRHSAKTWCLLGSLISNLSILCVFKYANFFLQNLNKIAIYLNIGTINKRLDLLLPVGISFYTFQALSYTLDVYRGNIHAEKNILNYALFVSFFPQLVAGPIERSGNLLAQIQDISKKTIWDLEHIKNGFLLMLWGLFQKLVIADRISLLVDNVINNYTNYGFAEIFIAIVLFAFQIYCDFGGYTNVARGAAQILGFSLINNFKQPYLARNIKDFWRRWHISLTSWFTDYLYIPLGGNKKGRARKYLNIFIVFGVSGLWHGASWNYVVWGLLHAMFQIIGDIKTIFCQQNTHSKSNASWSSGFRKIITTFILTDFAWIFFVCNNLTHAWCVIKQMFSQIYTTDIYSLGLGKKDWLFLIFSIEILLLVDILHENGKSIFQLINKQEVWFRWLLYIGLFWTTILFGVYGQTYDTGNFIYFQF